MHSDVFVFCAPYKYSYLLTYLLNASSVTVKFDKFVDKMFTCKGAVHVCMFA